MLSERPGVDLGKDFICLAMSLGSACAEARFDELLESPHRCSLLRMPPDDDKEFLTTARARSLPSIVADHLCAERNAAARRGPHLKREPRHETEREGRAT